MEHRRDAADTSGKTAPAPYDAGVGFETMQPWLPFDWTEQSVELISVLDCTASLACVQPCRAEPRVMSVRAQRSGDRTGDAPGSCADPYDCSSPDSPPRKCQSEAGMAALAACGRSARQRTRLAAHGPRRRGRPEGAPHGALCDGRDVSADRAGTGFRACSPRTARGGGRRPRRIPR